MRSTNALFRVTHSVFRTHIRLMMLLTSLRPHHVPTCSVGGVAPGTHPRATVPPHPLRVRATTVISMITATEEIRFARWCSSRKRGHLPPDFGFAGGPLDRRLSFRPVECAQNQRVTGALVYVHVKFWSIDSELYGESVDQIA